MKKSRGKRRKLTKGKFGSTKERSRSDTAYLLSNIAPPLDGTLASLLIGEYISLERRFLAGDWEPATLDGGQFCEISARGIYHIDSKNLNLTKSVDDCLQYVEDLKNTNKHFFPSRKDALNLCKAIRLAYKFRSNRGAVHIDPQYSANEMDSRLIMEAIRWILCEVVRIFWTGNTRDAARVVREIVTYRVPVVFREGCVPIVQNPSLSVGEEVLLLLLDSGGEGMALLQLKASIPGHPSTIEKATQRLRADRLVVVNQEGRMILTDLGRVSAMEIIKDSSILTPSA
jgi:hypothetical protein